MVDDRILSILSCSSNMKRVHTIIDIMKLLVPSPIFTLLMGYNQAYARKKYVLSNHTMLKILLYF